MTQCHESKTNSEARSDHKCVSPLEAIVVKALGSEDSAEYSEQAQNEDKYLSLLNPNRVALSHNRGAKYLSG